MGTLDRLERIARSWTGRLKRDRYYDQPDIFMILTDLGMQMKPETLAWVSHNATAMEEVAQGLYAAEDKLGITIVNDEKVIDAKFEPRVVEEDGKFAITITHKGKEYVVVEMKANG